MFADPGSLSLISPLAVRLPVEQIAAMRDDSETPAWAVGVSEAGMRRALLRYSHYWACGREECAVEGAVPRGEIETWLAGVQGSPTSVAMGMLSGHPSVMRGFPKQRLSGMVEWMALVFYGVFMVFELRGSPEGFDPVLEVVGREGPRLLAGFSLGLPLPAGASIDEVWAHGARGFG